MYRYDEFDHQMVTDRVAQFRGQVERRLSGEITENQFKPLRLMNGVYLQLHAYMLRICIPYGQLSSRQMHALADVARDYDKGYGHFTTRQNIQFNWVALKDIPDVLAKLATFEMHANQTSGNCIRNTTSDQLQGQPQTSLKTRGHGARSFANGLLFTRNSPICRVSSRLRSPLLQATGRR